MSQLSLLRTLIRNLASSRRLKSVEQFLCFDSPVDPLLSVVTLDIISYPERNIFYLLLPLCIHIIVWFDYIVANYVTVIPHRAHR
uniref:Uncharacterized protein n=1 Tax=Helianthus annuus TaxID=4232 RepID=A0A251TMG9_HELAN